MVRLVKYLKPYTLLILFAIVLLFIQANCDLALPDYLSRIVNTGIQQGGVEYAVPKAIRKSEMDLVVVFLSAGDKDLVLNNYTLVNQDSTDYVKYVKDYPALANGPIYVLKSIDKTELHRLNPILGKALLIVSGLRKALADPAKAATMAKISGFDLSRLPRGTDLFTVLAKLPAAQRSQMTAAMDRQFAALGDSQIIQSAVGVVKAEYDTLGMDTGSIQNAYILNIGIIMLLITLLSVACSVTVGLLAARTAAGLSRDLRQNVFKKVVNFSNAEFDKFSTASLITRSTNDITQIQMVVIMMIRMVFYAPILGVGGIIRAIDKDSSMWWIIALAVIVLLGLVGIVFSISLPRFKDRKSVV